MGPLHILLIAMTSTGTTSTTTVDRALVTGSSSIAPALADEPARPADEEIIPEDPMLAEEIPEDPMLAGEEETVLEVVVTGSTLEHTLEDTPVNTEVVGQKEIVASGAENVAELLEEHSGVAVIQTFRGRGSAIQIQGLNPEHVLILVDGERVTGRIDGAIDLERFPIERIERVEIVKGASSSIYGSDAMGGVINIITRKTRDAVDAQAKAVYGSLNSVDISGRAGFARDRYNVRVTGGYHRRDSYDLTPDNDNPATHGNEFSEVNAEVQGEIDITDTFSASLRADYLQRSTNGVDFVPNSGATFDRDTVTDVYSATLKPIWRPSEDTALTTSIYASVFEDQFRLDQRGVTDENPVTDTEELLSEASAQLDQTLFDGNILSVGVRGFYEELESERIDAGCEHRDRQRLALYAQDEWTLFEKRKLVLMPGVRVDMDSQFGTRPSPKMAMRFDPHETLAIRASYGTGFRAPAIRDLCLDFRNPGADYVITPNPDLDFETSKNLNAGVEWAPTRWFTTSVDVFRNDLDNLIEIARLRDPPEELPIACQAFGQCFRNQNIKDAVTQGVEAAIRLKFLRRMTFDLSYTFTDARDRELDRELEARPKHRLSGRLRVEDRPLGLSGSVRAAWVSARTFYADPDGNVFPLPGECPAAQPDCETERGSDAYLTLDARISKDLGEHMTAFVGAENLLDAGEVGYLPIPPRSFYGGLIGRYRD